MSASPIIGAQFKTDPWDHQLREFEDSAEAEARALFWQMRTGKTKICADTLSHQYREGMVDSAIIFAPNGVHANWVERELPAHMWDSVPYSAQAWRTKVAGLKGGANLSKAMKAAWEEQHAEWWANFDRMLVSSDLMVVSFNAESMTREDIHKAVLKMFHKRRGVFGVWDESTDYRTPGSSRTLRSRGYARHMASRRILDGTAATNSPLHLFSQFELLNKAALGWTRFGSALHKPTKTWTRGFRDRYAVFEEKFRSGVGNRDKTYEKVKEYVHLDELKAHMAPMASVVLRGDCSDLPEVQAHRVDIRLTAEQERVYAEVQAETNILIAQGQVATLKAATVRLGKLQQVVGGFLRDQDGVDHEIAGRNPKLDRLSDEVYLAPGKVIVWCQFQWEIDRVSALLRAEGHEVWEYHGRVSDDDKKRVRLHFNTDLGVKVLVGQVQSAGRGLELSGADTIIWYSHTFDAILREQAKERATKMGGGNIRMLDFVAGEVDRYVLTKTDAKVSIGDLVAGRGLQAVLQEMRYA